MLTTLRTDVMTALTSASSGIRVVEFIPERLNPPLVIVSAGEPYIEPQHTFYEYLVRLELTVVAGTATNAVVTNVLDNLIEAVLVRLEEWRVENVSQPFMLSANNANYLATRITITNNADLA